MAGSSSSGKCQRLPASSFQTSNEALREKIREYMMKNRACARADVYDNVRFGIGEIKSRLEELDNLTEKDVHGLSVRIKRRKHASSEDMYRLNHAFLQSNQNINTFANLPGALQVLIKELTGTNTEQQVCAAECLCNLSLGEAHVCDKISNSAGSYLITYLDSLEERLKRTSLWTIANIIATSIKATQTLLQMELLRKLWANYVSNNDDYCEDAAICLVLISEKSRNVLTEHDWQFISENALAKNPTAIAGEYHLQIIFNFGLIITDSQFKEAQILYFINYALHNLNNFNEIDTEKSRLRIIYAVRVLANLLASCSKAYDILLQQLGTTWQSNLSALFNKLFALPEKTFIVEALWLLKNVIALQQELHRLEVENFLEKLCLPKSNIEIK